LTAAAVVVTVLTNPAPASAQAAGSPLWYATAIVGAAGQSGQTLRFDNGPVQLSASSSYDPDLLAGAAVGRVFAGGWRGELEFAYQRMKLENVALGSGGPAGEGDYASTSVALNGLREFNLFGSPSARTYVGLGVAWLTEVDMDFDGGPTSRSYSGDGFGVQALVGARYDLGPKWFVDAGARYLYASNLKLDGEQGAEGRVTADYRPWAITFAVGYRF
jgi:outer membrane protein W